MKRILTIALCLAASAAAASTFESRLADTARGLGWSDADVARLAALFATNRAEFAAARRAKLAAAPRPDPVLEALRADARRRANRYAVLKRTVADYRPGRTNLVARQMAASLAQKIAEARAGWTNALQRVEEVRAKWQDAEARASAVRARLLERRAEYVQKRDKSVLSSTKAIYQLFIDVIDDLVAKFDG